VLLGRTPDQAPEPLTLDALRLPDPVPVTVPSELLHHRPDILAAEAAVQVSADQVGAAIAAKYPSLTLSASYGHGGFDWSTFASPAGAIWSVGGSLTQPLFHGGALEAKQRQAEAGYEGALSNYRQTVLSAFESVADDLATLDQDGKALAQAGRADRAAFEESRDLERRHALGAVPLATALAAGEHYHAAHIRYLRARAARLSDTAALFDAMGDPEAAPRPAADEMTVHLLGE
jgi:outer membrane protein TolC